MAQLSATAPTPDTTGREPDRELQNREPQALPRCADVPGLDASGSGYLHPKAVGPLLGLLIGTREADAAETWFATLADATRVRILQALSLTTEWCVGDLALALGLSVSALSHQLRYLLDRGVVTRRRSGRIVFYALADTHVRQVLRDALAHASEQPAGIA